MFDRLLSLPLGIVLCSPAFWGKIAIAQEPPNRTFIYTTSSPTTKPPSTLIPSSNSSSSSSSPSYIPPTNTPRTSLATTTTFSLPSSLGSSGTLPYSITFPIPTAETPTVGLGIPSSTTTSLPTETLNTGKVSYTTGVSWGPLNPPPPATIDPGQGEESSALEPSSTSTDTEPPRSYISQAPSTTYSLNSTGRANTTAPLPTETPTCTAFNKVGDCLPTGVISKEPCTNFDADGICWPDDPTATDTPTCVIYDDKGEVIDKAGPCTTSSDPTCTIYNDKGEVVDKAGPCTTTTPTDGRTCVIYNGRGKIIDKAGPCTTTATMPDKATCTTYDDLGEIVDVVAGNCVPDCLLDEYNNCLDPVSTSACDVTLEPGEPSTTYIFLPNPTTITVTITSDIIPPLTVIPEFTPPAFCYETPKTPHEIPGVSSRSSTTGNYGVAPAPTSSAQPTTSYVTSKNPVTIFTEEPSVPYPGGRPTGKMTVTSGGLGPLAPPPPATIPGVVDNPGPTGAGSGQDGSGDGDNPGGNSGGNSGGGPPPKTTTTIGGIPVIIGPTNVVIGPSTVTNGVSPPTTRITIGQQTFTVNPSQVIGPGATVARPANGGGVFVPTPMPTVISGIPVQLGPSVAVIQGTTYAIGPGAPQTNIVVNGQTISIGPGGLGFAQTTVAPPSQATRVVILGGDIISALGPSQAVIGGSTFTYGIGIPLETDVYNGETITIGPMGISYGSTTLGGASNPSKLQIGIAGGVAITQIGSGLAVIDGITYTIGPNSTPMTKVVNGKEVTIGPSGIEVGGATLTYPFNQQIPTQVVTEGGITFSRLGASLVDIGGITYTLGPGAKPTTRTYNGQTISIGPGGLGFKSTTLSITSSSPFPKETGASAKATSKKNGAAGLRCFYGVFGLGMAVGVGYNL